MAPTRSKRSPKKAPPSQARADWKDADELEMLAWLDYTLEKNKDAGPFKTLIVEHLEKTCSTTFTLPQIERKMKALWQYWRSEEATNKSEIYTLGTACLKHLPPGTREEIARKVDSLEDEAIAYAIESPRKTRSASRTVDWPLARSINLDLLGVNSTRKRPRDRSTSAAKDDQTKRQRHAIQENPQPKRENRDDGQQSREQRLVADSEDGLTDDGDAPRVLINGKRRTSTPTPLPAMHNIQIPRTDESQRSNEPRLLTNQPLLDAETLKRENSLLKERCSRLQTQLEEQRESHEGSIRFYEDKYSHAMKTCKDLQRNIVCLEFASSLSDRAEADSTSFLKALNDKQKRIKELEESLKDRKWLRRFSTLSSANAPRLDPKNVQNEMTLIGSSIRNVLSEHADWELHMTPNLEWNDDLLSLFSRMFDLDSSNPIDAARDLLISFHPSFQSVIHALTTSALCVWVFEADLRGLNVKSCTLLDKYRSFLAKQDGEVALRNLDFAAHRSLVDEEHFQQHVIPREATMLVDRLFRALTPLFTAEEIIENLPVAPLEAWSEEKPDLAEIFERALRFKANVVDSKDVFEMVLYTPRTPFDQHVMDAENVNGGQAMPAFGKTREVSLCLLPSFRVYDDDKKMVQRNNFVKKDSSQRAGAHTLSKALVVLADAKVIKG